MKKSDLLLLIALVCVAAILRAPITSIGSLIRIIQVDIPVSNAIFGLLTTIPLIAFALVSPFVSILSKRFGAGEILLFSLFAMGIGILIRSYFQIAGLFIGTIILGIAIAFGNVLIPGIIKARLHKHVGLATGLYITSLSAFAGLSSGISLPISKLPGMDWQNSLAMWLILLVIAIGIWYPHHSIRLEKQTLSLANKEKVNLLRTPLAWWVTIFMAMQSFIFYFMVAWLPSIIHSRAMSLETAGYYALGYQLMTIPAAFWIPQVAANMKDQRAILMGTALFYMFGIGMMLSARDPLVLFIATLVCGFSTGASFGLTMVLIPLRSSTAGISTQLSGMVQSGGYAFAALGPILMGAIYDATNSWTIPLIFVISLTAILFVSGYFSGQNTCI